MTGAQITALESWCESIRRRELRAHAIRFLGWALEGDQRPPARPSGVGLGTIQRVELEIINRIRGELT